MRKSLPRKLHLKQQLYSRCLAKGTFVINHISTFKEIIAALETIEVKYDEEELGLILLCSLPSSYSFFIDTILYSHDSLTLEEVYESLCSKETMKELFNGFEAKAKGLVDRGRFQEKGFSNSHERGRSTSKTRNRSCKYCKKKGHIIDDFYKQQNKNKEAEN